MTYLRKFLVAIVGGIILAIGVAMIVLPGPAVLVIPAGLAILAVEFAFARRWRDTFLARVKSLVKKNTN